MWKSGSTVPCQARRGDTSSVQGTIETAGGKATAGRRGVARAG
jgi:hypothetical protein